jgi:hypothetical protein
MRCARCQHENPERATFCNECAIPLLLMASGGGHGTRPDERG